MAIWIAAVGQSSTPCTEATILFAEPAPIIPKTKIYEYIFLINEIIKYQNAFEGSLIL